MYLIFSQKRTGPDGIIAWWRNGGAGYTTDMNEAGRFSQDKAKEIISQSHGASFAIKQDDVRKLKTRTIVDTSDGENLKQLMSLGAFGNFTK